MRFFLLPLLCLVALLSSCIDGEEEIWIETDGSGRLEATYTMPKAFMDELGGAETLTEKLRAAAKKDDSITIGTLEHGTGDDGRQFLHFTAEFTDLRELAKFPQKHLRDPSKPNETASEEALFGEINLSLSGLLMSIDRKIDLAPILPESAKSNPAFLGSSTFQYTFHLPVVPTEHDAHEISADGKTLTWSFLLRDYTDKPMTIWAKAPLPLPWWLWAGGIVVGIFLLLIIIIWAAKRTIAKRR